MSRQAGLRPTLGVLFVVAALCAARPAAPAGDTSAPAPALIETRCGKVAPDSEFFIPEPFEQKVVPSLTGGYGYRSGICPFWVVDFSLNRLSNSQIIDGQRVFDDTEFWAVPYDLPSSAAANGDRPMVQEDCERLRVEYIVYKKFKHEAHFAVQQHNTVTASWVGSGCVVNPYGKLRVSAPTANVLVIRVATRVKLRSSWQETAAKAVDAPPM